jgi:hypothetical protein
MKEKKCLYRRGTFAEEETLLSLATGTFVKKIIFQQFENSFLPGLYIAI